MAIGTNDSVVKLGTRKTLEASGASTADGSYVQANDAGYSRATDGSDAPDAVFTFKPTYATGPTVGTFVHLFARRKNTTVSPVEQAPDPDANYQHTYLCSFPLDSATTQQDLEQEARNVPAEFDCFLLNEAGQTLSAGWALYIQPATLGPAA